MQGHYLLIRGRFQPHDLSKQIGFTFQQCVSVMSDTDFYHCTVSCRHATNSAAPRVLLQKPAHSLDNKLSYEVCTACMMFGTKLSEVPLESSDVCRCSSSSGALL